VRILRARKQHYPHANCAHPS